MKINFKFLLEGVDSVKLKVLVRLRKETYRLDNVNLSSEVRNFYLLITIGYESIRLNLIKLKWIRTRAYLNQIFYLNCSDLGFIRIENWV